jgi:hypothetical protein
MSKRNYKVSYYRVSEYARFAATGKVPLYHRVENAASWMAAASLAQTDKRVITSVTLARKTKYASTFLKIAPLPEHLSIPEYFDKPGVAAVQGILQHTDDAVDNAIDSVVPSEDVATLVLGPIVVENVETKVLQQPINGWELVTPVDATRSKQSVTIHEFPETPDDEPGTSPEDQVAESLSEGLDEVDLEEVEDLEDLEEVEELDEVEDPEDRDTEIELPFTPAAFRTYADGYRVGCEDGFHAGGLLSEANGVASGPSKTLINVTAILSIAVLLALTVYTVHTTRAHPPLFITALLLGSLGVVLNVITLVNANDRD